MTASMRLFYSIRVLSEEASVISGISDAASLDGEFP